MDCNCGRLFNSNSPPKSLKLYSPIWMDSYDSQFNMWNDFDSLSLAPFFLYKLGIFFIIAKPSHIDWNSFRWIQTIWSVSFQFCHHTSIETLNLSYQISFCSKYLLQSYFLSLYIIFDSSTCFHLSFVAFSVILQMVRFRWTDFNFKSFLVINNALVIPQFYHTLESLTEICSTMFVSNILLRFVFLLVLLPFLLH